MAKETNDKKDLQTVRIPFIGEVLFRGTSASKDQRYVNVYFDVFANKVTEAKHYFMLKRPGLERRTQPSSGAGTGRGVYSWRGDLYSVVGTKIFKNTTDLGVTLTTSSGIVGFAEVHPTAGTQYLAINDGVKLYAIATGGAVTTVTVNFPTPNTTDLIYFDTYLFVLKTDGSLWNCNANDPTTWSASQFIISQMGNGAGIGLARQSNILLVFTDRNIQAFYDAANISGSPLSNVEQGMQQLGCASQNSIAQLETLTVWVCNSQLGGFSVYALDGISSLNDLGTPAINRILNAEGSSISTCRGLGFLVAGHKFYALNLTSANRTFVYDFSNGIWTEWEAAGGGAQWPIVSTYQHANQCIAQHASNGWVYNLKDSVFQDDSVNFTWLARFARLDLDDNVYKFCHRAEIIGDRQTSTTNILLQYSDDDWLTLSSARTLDMASARPMASNLGRFRRRAWQLSGTNNQPFRGEALELKFRLGTD